MSYKGRLRHSTVVPVNTRLCTFLVVPVNLVVVFEPCSASMTCIFRFVLMYYQVTFQQPLLVTAIVTYVTTEFFSQV